MDLIKLFDKPKIMSVVADVNSGKSMLLYHIIETLRKQATFSLYTFGFRIGLDFAKEIYSVEELEQIENSLIIIDETFTLFDLGNRKNKKAVENTLRLINHNNNILVLCMVPENVKKFLASKIDILFFKKCTIPDFINGSMTKRIVDSYSGYERGTTILGLKIDEALIFDGKHYHKIHVPYYEQYDSKIDNENILKFKKGGKKK
ncbi:MAG: hypothetical protein ACOC4Y_01385 [bacterium]